MKFLLVNMVTFVCVSIGGYMAFHDRPGWGWFLIVGLICFHGYTVSKEG